MVHKMSGLTDRVADTVVTWDMYRGRVQTRLVAAFLVLAACAAIGLTLFPEHAGSWLVTGVVGFVAVLVHPMALVAWLAIAILSFDVVDISFAARPTAAVGVGLAIAGLIGTTLRNSRGVPFLSAIAIVWVGLLLIHPLLFVLLGLVPLAMIYGNRRRAMRSQPNLIDIGPAPDDWAAALEEVEQHAGLRYVGTLRFHYEAAGHSTAAVFRLGDGRGFAVALDQWLVTHHFGNKLLFTSGSRWTVTLPGELGQLAPDRHVVAVIRAQRRVLARLMRWGIRPDRLTDDEGLARLVLQFERDAAARRAAGPATVVRSMVDEELDFRRDGGKGLLDSARGIRDLERWAAA